RAGEEEGAARLAATHRPATARATGKPALGRARRAAPLARRPALGTAPRSTRSLAVPGPARDTAPPAQAPPAPPGRTPAPRAQRELGQRAVRIRRARSAGSPPPARASRYPCCRSLDEHPGDPARKF